jgi:hypothetical protein
MKPFRLALKLLAGFLLLVVVLAVAGVVLVNSKTFQQRVLKQTTLMLSERLHTQVTIDSIDIRFMTQQLRLYGLHVADQQQRPLLDVRQAGADVDISELLGRRFLIKDVELSGARALLLKPSKDSTANFQFLLDAFKKQPKAEKDTVKMLHKRMEFDIHSIRLNDIQIVYNDMTVSLAQAIAKGRKGKYQSTVQLQFTTNNHKPRKNFGKPKRGFFDAGHLDLSCDMKLAVDATEKDTLRLQLTEFHAADSVSGIDIRNLQANARLAGKQLLLNDVQVQQKHTQLHIANARMQLPSKKDSIPLSFQTGTIIGTVYLQDISRAFAPVLSKFTLPLLLSCTMSGNNQSLSFRQVRVGTTDKRLAIAATGDITQLKSKEKLTVLFHVSQMKAKSGIKEKIISQFPVKRFLMKQLHNLGDISYKGSFRVIRKEERFWGTLGTAVGSLKFQFWLDERNKYVIGNASTARLDFGRAMGMKDVGALAAKANFKIDISKPRTAAMRRKLGGKLPIGELNATINDCSYKGVHVRNIDVNMISDGAWATGDVIQRGNWRDISCSFSFANTDEMQKLKVKHARMRFHKMSDEAKQAKRERKEAKKAEKEAKKAERKALKEAKKAEKKPRKFLFF